MTPPPPPPPYPPPTPPKGSHFMNSGHLWKYQWRKRLCKGQLKSLPSPTNLPHPLKKGTPKGLVISYSLKGRVVWDAVFWFFIDSIYRYPYKALCIWLIPLPTPPLNLQSIFFSPPFNSVGDSWFPHCSPWKPCNPPSPLKKIFYPTPLAIKMTLPLVSLLIQKLSPKRPNFLNDLLLLTLPLPTI